MQQKALSVYLVQPGEVVTIEVEAVKVGDLAVAAVDGNGLKPISSAPKTFQFTVTAGPGNTHFSMVEGSFPGGEPDDARFDIFVSGSMGGGRFKDVSIIKTDPTHRRGIEFRC